VFSRTATASYRFYLLLLIFRDFTSYRDTTHIEKEDIDLHARLKRNKRSIISSVPSMIDKSATLRKVWLQQCYPRIFLYAPVKKITVNYSTMPMPHHRDVLNICNRNSKPSVRKQLQLIKKLRKKENEDKANLQSIYAIDHDIGTRGCFSPLTPVVTRGDLLGYIKSHGSQNIESTFTCTFSNIIKRTIAYFTTFFVFSN
jgi:hypothetical protein